MYASRLLLRLEPQLCWRLLGRSAKCQELEMRREEEPETDPLSTVLLECSAIFLAMQPSIARCCTTNTHLWRQRLPCVALIVQRLLLVLAPILATVSKVRFCAAIHSCVPFMCSLCTMHLSCPLVVFGDLPQARGS